MDWLSEVVDASGCEVSHVLDLQMICSRTLFSDSPAAAKFAPAYAAPSRVFLVSYFSKDFERGFGVMESCMLKWYCTLPLTYQPDVCIVLIWSTGTWTASTPFSYETLPFLHYVFVTFGQVHFGDDSNSYDYLRYPRLHFVIRNHPANVVYGVDTFHNILHLGIGYKIGFWPSALRDISLRRVHPLLF